MKRSPPVKKPVQVKAEFNRIGKPVTAWAREHGYTPSLVYKILNGDVPCNYGKSHEIAVLLGMKNGEIERRAA